MQTGLGLTSMLNRIHVSSCHFEPADQIHSCPGAVKEGLTKSCRPEGAIHAKIKPQGCFYLGEPHFETGLLVEHIHTLRKNFACAFLALAVFLIPLSSLAKSGSKDNADIKFAYIPYTTDLSSREVSKEAVQLAEQLKLSRGLKEVSALRDAQNQTELSLEQRMHLLELREEIREVIEQTRMEIDYIDAEFSREEAVYSELLQAYTDTRDRRVDRINAYGFRTNGILWAVGEALDIPTYASPKYAIPSGAIGIVAGLIPSAFSLYALRQEHGGKFERDPHPNMLSKLFNYPVSPEIDYPDSIWTWLNSVPPVGTEKSRLHFLMSTWQHDVNINHFSIKPTRAQLDSLTATRQNDLTIRVISDRLVMLRSVRAVILGITRPLLELLLILRGEKTLTLTSDTTSGAK
jgi:hypothetical protein